MKVLVFQGRSNAPLHLPGGFTLKTGRWSFTLEGPEWDLWSTADAAYTEHNNCFVAVGEKGKCHSVPSPDEVWSRGRQYLESEGIFYGADWYTWTWDSERRLWIKGERV
jgi:hypothetical protein